MYGCGAEALGFKGFLARKVGFWALEFYRLWRCGVRGLGGLELGVQGFRGILKSRFQARGKFRGVCFFGCS